MGVALSPIPIIAVVLMLTTPKARLNWPAFALGWLVGLCIVGAVVLLLAGPADTSDSGEPTSWIGVELALGLLLLLVAATAPRSRTSAPRRDAANCPGPRTAPVPGWRRTAPRLAGRRRSSRKPDSGTRTAHPSSRRGIPA